jgi:hypothetical protein
MELWRAIPEHPEFEVSDAGGVRALARTRLTKTRWGGMRTMHIQGRNISGWCCNGYRAVVLSRGKQEYVHRLVALVFIGPAPDGPAEVNHINGDKSDNRVSNLEWVTHGENMRHAREVLMMPQWRKVTPENVHEMRTMLAAGVPQRDVAAAFGVSQPTVSRYRAIMLEGPSLPPVAK